MSAIRWILVILGMVAFIGALILAYQNRSSERVLGNAAPAFLIAMIGVFATLVLSLRSEKRELSFPSEFIIDTDSKLPFHCEEFPESLQYSGGQRVYSLVKRMLEEFPHLSTYESGDSWSDKANDEARRLYMDVLLREVIECLHSAFAASWDPVIKHYDLPTGPTSSTEAIPERDGVRVSLEQFQELLPDSYSLRIDDLMLQSGIRFPPGSRLRVSNGANDRTLIIDNSFTTVSISIARRRSGMSIGDDLKRMCGMALELGPDKGHWAMLFDVTLAAQFSAWRIGNPDMEAHRRWVDTMFEEIQRRCDSQMKWRQIKERYSLFKNQLGTRP